MANIGSAAQAVNTQAAKLLIGGNEYVNVTSKRAVFRKSKRRMPTTSSGVIYFSGQGEYLLFASLAYSNDELGSGSAQNVDQLIKKITATGEIPSNTWTLVTTGKDGTSVRTWTLTMQMNQFEIVGPDEGGLTINMEFQIIDAEPNVS